MIIAMMNENNGYLKSLKNEHIDMNANKTENFNNNDKNIQTSWQQTIAKHKKSCLGVICLIIVIIILVIVWAHNCPPDHFMSKYKLPWSSADYKLLNKNHVDKSRRSDNKEDNWNKQDFLNSVSKFNKLAEVSMVK